MDCESSFMVYHIQPDQDQNWTKRLSADNISEDLTLHAGIFSCFYCCLLTFFKINFFKKFFQKNYQNVKQFGSS